MGRGDRPGTQVRTLETFLSIWRLGSRLTCYIQVYIYWLKGKLVPVNNQILSNALEMVVTRWLQTTIQCPGAWPFLVSTTMLNAGAGAVRRGLRQNSTLGSTSVLDITDGLKTDLRLDDRRESQQFWHSILNQGSCLVEKTKTKQIWGSKLGPSHFQWRSA